MTTDSRIDELQQVIARILAEVKRDASLAERIGPGTNLLEEVGLDSLELTDFVLRLEEALGLTVDYERFARQRDDLDIGIVEKILAATRPARSKVYLWGGEPLVYRDWDRLTELLAEDPRWTVLCTNGLGMDKKLDSLLWHGETASRALGTLACGLTPICSKCVQLYLHGA